MIFLYPWLFQCNFCQIWQNPWVLQVEGLAGLRLGYAKSTAATAELISETLPFSGGLYISEMALTGPGKRFKNRSNPIEMINRLMVWSNFSDFVWSNHVKSNRFCGQIWLSEIFDKPDFVVKSKKNPRWPGKQPNPKDGVVTRCLHRCIGCHWGPHFQRTPWPGDLMKNWAQLMKRRPWRSLLSTKLNKPGFENKWRPKINVPWKLLRDVSKVNHLPRCLAGVGLRDLCQCCALLRSPRAQKGSRSCGGGENCTVVEDSTVLHGVPVLLWFVGRRSIADFCLRRWNRPRT